MPAKKKLIVATRPSLLAYTQTEQTVQLLRNKNPEIEFEIVKFSTKGDRVLHRSLTEFGGTGVFVKELEHAMLENEADIAIHSLKDVPSGQPEGLCLMSFPQREDPRDVFLTRKGENISELHEGFVLGTGSPRRRVQIAAIRPDVQFKDIRGNIDTRMSKLEEGEYDAIILAAAGMNRLGKSFDKKLSIETSDCIPAVGQGAIALECRANDFETQKVLRSINHQPTEIAVLTERAFMAEIEGGCKFPLAAHATVQNGMVTMDAVVGDLTTNRFVKERIVVPVADSQQAAINLAIEMKKTCQKEGINFYL
ncbi:MAG: hydroxymethylbilane synthase [Marinifilaceae bacterium]